MSSPSNSYNWLGPKGCAPQQLNNTSTSCLTWYGGNMPPSGNSSDPAATADIDAWVAAGAQDN
jgi:hypothetical protein